MPNDSLTPTARFSIASKNRRTASLFIAFLLLVAVACVSWWTGPSEANDEPHLSALFRNGVLEVALPYQANLNFGVGEMVVEVLAPDNSTISQQKVPLRLDNGSHGVLKIRLPLPASLQREDIVWYRLRYGFSGAVSSNEIPPHGLCSISRILRYPMVRLLGQKEYGAGSTSALRLVAVDGLDGTPLPEGTLRISLKSGAIETPLTSGNLNRRGTLNAPITFPANTLGKADLKIALETPLGSQEVLQPITLVRRENILITTDKPIYQPGQMLHLRALALDRFTRAAAAARPAVIEIEDAKGNKIFKRRTRTDNFGVAFADFQLADEVNMGAFKLRVILGDEDDPNHVAQERTVTVDRYVLPKFKIEVKFDGESQGKARRYYAPGETVAGTITAKYLFGKPLQNATVNLKLSTFDVSTVELAKTELKTDGEGNAKFSTRLADHFAGSSFTQGSAPVAFEVSVTDTANHTETRNERLLVSANPILIMAVPESGKLIPGLENHVYLLTSYPDGTPAAATLKTNFSPAVLKTDANGFARVTMKPGGPNTTLDLTAQDASGKTGTAHLTLTSRNLTEDNLLLRTDHAIYKVGDTVDITATATKQKGSVYIDVIKDRQTVLTTALDFENGVARFPLDLSANLFGTLEIRAYMFGRNADPISDRKIIYVDPADDLKISAKTPKESFKPGESAVINFTVTDSSGRPQRAVLGVEIVDEAVFALSEKQPGFEKIFFFLEQELLKPQYEIHGFSSEEILQIDSGTSEVGNRRETAAQVLLAAATEVDPYTAKNDLGKDFLNVKQNEYSQKYQQAFQKQTESFISKVKRY